MSKKVLSLAIIVCFFLTSLGPYPQAHADTVLGLPAPGTMVNLSPAYEPVIIKGLTVHKDNPFLFDFIVDVGQDQMSGEPLKKEGEKLIKYFLASLAIPDKDVWVNLSPYEKNRMILEALGQTDMGRDLLEQDYILKQITASLIYPEKQLGKTFWDKVYAKAQQMYGTTEVPVNTFNKVWILADRAEVFERNQTAFVVDSHLKVMLEEDYLALRKHSQNNNVILSPSTLLRAGSAKDHNKLKDSSASPQNDIRTLSSQIVREIVLPQLEKEVNTGENFSNLRQILNSLILANWYKKNLKQALLNQVYTNQSKVKGIDLNDPTFKQQIYEQYLKAYKKGIFNYIKEDATIQGSTIPRKYFSGGFDQAQAVIDPAVTDNPAELGKAINPDRAMVSLETVFTADKPRDAAMAEAVLDFRDLPKVEKPGAYPFTRGIHPAFRAEVDFPYWTPRQYAGFNTARETNERFRALSDNNFSLAFSNSTQIGMDSDDPLARYNIGEEGAPIDTIEDLETVFQGIDILSPKVSTSMTINASAAVLQGMYYGLAIKRLMSERNMSRNEALAWVRKNVRGTTQNDNIKEREIRNNFGLSQAGSDRLTNDMLEFNAGSRWNTISVSGYHMREAGASDVQEVAFTIRNAMYYAKNFLKNQREGSKVTVDELLQQLPFFFDSYLFEETGEDFVREVAKFRAARRLWAKITRHEFGATDDGGQKALKMRFHSQTSGVPLESDPTGLEEMLNVVRILFESLAAIYGGTQTLHIDAYDEPVRLPTEHSVKIAKESHQLLLKILGDNLPVDPLSEGGSELLKKHTKAIEEAAFDLIRREMSFKNTPWTPELEQFLKKAIQEEVVGHLGSLDNAKERLDQYTDSIEREAWQLIQQLQKQESLGTEKVEGIMRGEIQNTAYSKFILRKNRLAQEEENKKLRLFISSAGEVTLKEMTGEEIEALKGPDNKAVSEEITDAMLEDKMKPYSLRQREVLQNLSRFKANRDQTELERTLGELTKAAQGNANVMPYVIDAELAGATVGEIMKIFRQIYGEYNQLDFGKIRR